MGLRAKPFLVQSFPSHPRAMEKKAIHYEAMLHLACDVITLQQAGVLA